MAKRYEAHGVRSVFIYTQEAHPGEQAPAHTSLSQKIDAARQMVDRWSIQRPMLVDDLDGSLHKAYGELPNMAWIIHKGRIVYKASWTNAQSIESALAQLVWEIEQVANGRTLATFHEERQVGRIQDREAFMNGLLASGPRAVEEFIAAAEHSWGVGPARGMKEWWRAYRDGEGER